MDVSKQNHLTKCLKSYLTAKKYYDSDIDKSLEYFKQCIKCVNIVKQTDKIQYWELLEETENECIKYITLSILYLINKPFDTQIKDSKDNSIHQTTIEPLNLFNIIETGEINYMKQFKYGEIDFKLYNDNGLTALHYAIKYGDTRFIKEALILGASIDEINANGHTLLEYACLETDPNMISFLLLYGADMKKHLIFREGKKYTNKGDQIDIVLIEKYICENYNDINSLQNREFSNDSSYNLKYLKWLSKYLDFNVNSSIRYSDLYYKTQKNNIVQFITIYDIIKYLDKLLDSLNEISRNTYIDIIKEEIIYDLNYDLGCPKCKLDIILYYLIPFINYANDINLQWVLSLEIKYLIYKIINMQTKIDTKQFKYLLKELIYEKYVATNLIREGYAQILLYQWILKIKI
jgi:ankyrin repeat protein